MENILLLLSPFVVAGITYAIKQLKSFSKKKGLFTPAYRASILRLIVGLFAFCSVIATSILSDSEVGIVEIETISNTILVFLGATGTYFLGDKLKKRLSK